MIVNTNNKALLYMYTTFDVWFWLNCNYKIRKKKNNFIILCISRRRKCTYFFTNLTKKKINRNSMMNVKKVNILVVFLCNMNINDRHYLNIIFSFRYLYLKFIMCVISMIIIVISIFIFYCIHNIFLNII